MTQSTENQHLYRSHFLGGWLTSKQAQQNGQQCLDAIRQAGQSTLPCHSIILGRSGGITTDTLFEQGNICCAITGQPRWKDSSVQQLAEQQGHGAALVTAYTSHGKDLTQQLQGTFSLVIFDNDNDIVFAATDQLGQHPLYYAEENGVFVVGSSASIVLSHPEVSRQFQPQGLYDYVYFHMVPSPHSIFKGLKKLPAGHSLHYSSQQCSVINYYAPQFKEQSAKSFSDLGASLKNCLKESVARSIPSNTKIGAFLSGGLDSSTVAGMLAELQPDNAHAYSIGFSAKGYDEMEYARLTAKHFGIHLHEYYVTPEDVVDALPLVAASYDEPFGNSSALPAYFCAKIAAEDGVQCLLAGDGGDELFAGNERYVKQRIFENYSKLPGGLRRGVIEPLINHLPGVIPLANKARSYIQQANIPLPDRLQSYNFLHRHAANEIFTDEFIAEVDTAAPIALQRNIYHRPTSASTLNRMLYLDWQYTLADNDLRKVSHMCALAGVDVAYPMLDSDLLELACEVPSHWKIKGNDLRHFYKQSLTGWLHNDTINKKKQGFGLPFGVWMETHKPLQDMAYEHLVQLKKRSFFKDSFIDNTINMHRNQHAAYYGELIWILMVLEMWLEAHG